MWEVEVTDEFVEWWNGLTVDQQEALTDRVDLLAERGPDLGRPVVDRIHSSRHHHMKELRAAKGGDKTGESDAWYEWAVPLADDLYDTYLVELRNERLI